MGTWRKHTSIKTDNPVKKKNKKYWSKKKIHCDLQNTIKRNNIQISTVSEEKFRKIIQEIMTENLPNLRDLAVQGHEAESKERDS